MTALTMIGMACCAGKTASMVFSRDKASVGSKGDGFGFEWPVAAWRAAAWAIRSTRFVRLKQSGADQCG